MTLCWDHIECDCEERGFIRLGRAEQVGPGEGGQQACSTVVLCLLQASGCPRCPLFPIIRPAWPLQRRTLYELTFHCAPETGFPFYSQKQSFAAAGDPTAGGSELNTSSLWADKSLMEVAW